MVAETDARVKNGKSVHSFWIRSRRGQTLFEKTVSGFDERSTEAELHTIIQLLFFIQKKGIDKIKIYTDCKPIVRALQSGRSTDKLNLDLLQHLLKSTNSKLYWRERSKNKRCDSNCRDPLKLYKGGRLKRNFK